MKDDLISKTAAIDAVEEIPWYHQNKNGEMVQGANSREHQAWYKADDIYHALYTLPPAQLAQDLPNGCTDTISRQAAIKSIQECADAAHSNYEWDREEGYLNSIDCINALPPAQPVEDARAMCGECDAWNQYKSRKQCEDAVSRFEVLRLIDYSSHDLNDSVDNRYMQNEIKQLPSVTPKQLGWIPVTERLPKTEEKVLITCEYLDIYGKPHRYVCKAFHVDRYTMISDKDWWDEGCDEYREEDDQYYALEGWYEFVHNWGDYNSVRITEDKVVAWCELPTPYREGGQDD